MPTSSQNPEPEWLTPKRLEEIRARAEAAYPGPWHWRGNTEVRHLRLSSPHGGGMTVMDFVRYGMNGAQPRFAISYLMHKAEELVEYEVAAWSKDIYRKDVSGIDHPDARFIAHAREDVPALLAEIDRLRTEIAASRAAVLDEAANRVTADADRMDRALGTRTETASTKRAVANDLRSMAAEARAAQTGGAREERPTPCSRPNVCEDGGDPCDCHEREWAHAEGEHELCGDECAEGGEGRE